MSIAIDMDGKVALVTGAASGLGRATAVKLAQAGARLWLVDVNSEGLNETKRLLPEGDHQVAIVDLADPEACHAAVDAAVAHYGQFDALCNVAGLIYLANSPDMARPLWDRTLAVNLTAPFLLSQAAIPHLMKVNGAIVNVVSSAAFIG